MKAGHTDNRLNLHPLIIGVAEYSLGKMSSTFLELISKIRRSVFGSDIEESTMIPCHEVSWQPMTGIGSVHD
jgi:hypothetical protein